MQIDIDLLASLNAAISDMFALSFLDESNFDRVGGDSLAVDLHSTVVLRRTSHYRRGIMKDSVQLGASVCLCSCLI